MAKRTDYIIVGYIFPSTIRSRKTNKVFDLYSRIHIPYLENHDGVECSLLTDTEFYNIIFGKVLCSTSSVQGFPLQELNVDAVNVEKIMDSTQLLFGDYVEEIGSPQLITFTSFK